jgi:hypothetical protein
MSVHILRSPKIVLRFVSDTYSIKVFWCFFQHNFWTPDLTDYSICTYLCTWIYVQICFCKIFLNAYIVSHSKCCFFLGGGAFNDFKNCWKNEIQKVSLKGKVTMPASTQTKIRTQKLFLELLYYLTFTFKKATENCWSKHRFQKNYSIQDVLMVL